MKQLILGISALILTALTAVKVVAVDPSGGLTTAALSVETRKVLIREMQAISEAMGRIHTAVVTGDHVTVVEEARKIHDSFVLAQELTVEQRTEISTTLPAAFVAADRSFHGLARKLMHAGEQNDPELERLWLQEMTRACQACHKEHAAARFPGLAPQAR